MTYKALFTADWQFQRPIEKDSVLADIGRVCRDVQLSRGTVTRRCEGMAEDVEEQLRKDVEQCQCFSLQFDESTDVVDVAQLCVFIRAAHHFTIKRTHKR